MKQYIGFIFGFLKRSIVALYDVFMTIIIVSMLLFAWYYASKGNLTMTIFCCMVFVADVILYVTAVREK